MKKTITLLACLLCMPALAQISSRHPKAKLFLNKLKEKTTVSHNRTQTLCVKDSTIFTNWNVNTSSWKSYLKHEYGYDGYLNETSNTSYNLSNNSWKASGRTLRTFNGGVNVLVELRQSADFLGNWKDNSQQTYTYDSQNNLLSQFYESWNSINSTWTKGTRTTNTYQQNNLTTSHSEHWDNAASTWISNSKDIYTYSGNNLMTETYQSWDLSSSALVNKYKDTYSYDIFNHPMGITEQLWDIGSSQWINELKIVIAFSGNNMTSAIISEWNTSNNTWVNSDKITFTYDANNNQLSELDQIWDTGSQTWKNSYKYSNTYTQNRLTMQLNQEWITNAWKNDDRYTYTYDSNGNQITQTFEDLQGSAINNSKTFDFYNCTTVGMYEQSTKTEVFKLYPNPVQSELHITADLDYTIIRILNITGKEVMRSEGSKNTISVSLLEKGIYFLQVLDKGQNILATEKFVKE